MEHKPNSHIPVGLLNDQKYQSTPQNGAILLVKLQQKVARLEIALRDKESELTKLTSSSKASYVNELKIQTEVYYQEVLRLKNQLNRLQELKIQSQIVSSNEHNEKKSSKKSVKDAEAQAQSVDKSLQRSIEKLIEENDNLSTKLSLIHADKERLADEYRNLVIKMKEQDSNKICLEENTTQTSPRSEAQPSPRSETQPSPKHQITDETLNLLKLQIEELQNKEKTWEEERSTYKELVLSLKEDRIFFKDTSQKRHDELWALQKELVKLQKDIGGFQLNGKPLCKQCTKPSYRTTKLARKIVVKDMATSTTPRHSNSQEGSNSTTTEKSSKCKNSSSGSSSRRLPAPLKTPPKDVSHSSVSKSPSSTTSSGSSSAQPSPAKKSPKPITKSSSMRLPSSAEKPLREKLSSRTTSGSSLSADDPHASSVSRTQRSGSLSSPKRVISPSQSSPSKQSPSKRVPSIPQVSSPLKKPEITKQRREKKSSTSSSGASTPVTKALQSPKKHFDDKEHDDSIALEILKDLDTIIKSDSNINNDTIPDDNKNDTGLPSSRSSQTLEEEGDPRIPNSGSNSQGESGCGDSQEMDPVEESCNKMPEDAIVSLLCLLDSHLSRKKKLMELQSLNKGTSSTETNSSPSSVSRNPTSSKKASDSKVKSTLSRTRQNSVGKYSPKFQVKFPPKVSRAHSSPKKSPVKVAKDIKRTVSYDSGGENMKDIDKMICLLEGHIARKALLALYAEK